MQKQQAVIDRFEGDMAVCQTLTGEVFEIPRNKLPAHISEGDCLELCEGVWMPDEKTTEQRKQSLRKKLNGLFRHE